MALAGKSAPPAEAQPGGAVPDAVAPPERHPRFPLVDGTRAIAVLLVIGVHVAVASAAINDSLGGRLLSHLNLGVAIFFVISGFLLYRLFIAHRAGGPPGIPIGSYLWNRLLRIYPAYALVLTVLIIWPGVDAFSGVPLWKEYGLMQTLPLGGTELCGDLSEGCGLAHTWSLVVEATFYLSLPLYVLASEALTRGRRRAQWAAWDLGLLAVLSVISLAFEFDLLGVTSPWVDNTVLGFFPWFALGMAMAVLSVTGIGSGLLARTPGLLWGLAASGYLALSLWLPPTSLLYDDEQRLGAFLAFGLISALIVAPAVFGSERGGAPRRLLATRPMAWLGLISYGLFLWHVAVATELAEAGVTSYAVLLAATVVVSIAFAAASYYGLERWVLRRKRHSSGRSARR